MSASTLDERVLAAITRYFRLNGYSPSYIDVGLAVGIEPRHVARPLKRLAGHGVLTFTPGKPRSIVLARRLANLSDTEWEMEGIRRGYQQPVRSSAPGLTAAFAGVANWGIETPPEMSDLLGQLEEC